MKPCLPCCLVFLGATLSGCSFGFRSEGLELPYVIRPASVASDLGDGEVYIAVLIDPEGRPTDWLVVGASAPELEPVALAQLRQTTFAPARFNGRPVPAHLGLVFAYTDGVPKLSATAVEYLGGMRPRLRLRSPAPLGVVQLDQLDARPRLLHEVRPQAGSRPGRAKLQFFIDPDGRIRLPMVIEADDHELGSAALEAVVQWRFAPPLRHGQPVSALVRQEFRFGQ